MTPFIVVTIAFIAVLVITVGVRIVGDMGRPVIDGAVHLVAEGHTPDEGWCILCRRHLPDDKLEYVVSDRTEMWCVDLASCKAWRDEWMETVP